MLLYLIRHAQSQNNARPAYCRVEDPPLTAVGRLQTQYLAEWLRTIEFDMLVTSPVLRALQTTRAIHNRTGHHVYVWGDMFEEGGMFRGFGPNKSAGGPGMTRSQIIEQVASSSLLSTLDPSITDEGWWGRPRESPDEASRRANAVAKRITHCVDTLNTGIVVVTHDRFVRRLLLNLLGESRDAFQATSLHNAGVTRLVFDSNAWSLERVNDVSHLPSRLVSGNGP